MASFLISIKGILLIGGMLLAWVCWRFYKDLKAFNAAEQEGPAEGAAPKKFGAALVTIMLADVSMSLDNVVAVAAIAREDTRLLVFGLALAIFIMAVFASLIMKVMVTYRWLSYAGLVFLVYLTVIMLYDGGRDIGWIRA
jgi:predicted tellurium resistance membrane protein TerC